MDSFIIVRTVTEVESEWAEYKPQADDIRIYWVYKPIPPKLTIVGSV